METASALDQLLNPQAGWLTPISAQKLIDWTPSDELRHRIEELGQKANCGQLSAEEDAEYRAYLDAAEVISLLQAKARRLYRPADYAAWLDILPGRWQGEFARGNEGAIEAREPLS